MGYILALVRVGGFAAGGLAAFGWLSGVPYCDACGRYLQKVGTQTRYTVSNEETVTTFRQVLAPLLTGRHQEAIDLQGKVGELLRLDLHQARSRIVLSACTKCNTTSIELVAETANRDGWDVMKVRLGDKPDEVTLWAVYQGHGPLHLAPTYYVF